jgi:hypothetical protein
MEEDETAALRETETVGASERDDDVDSVCEIEELEREVVFALWDLLGLHEELVEELSDSTREALGDRV